MTKQTDNQHEGAICWRSPSNIALVKYWGKKGHQLPANPSISFTLSQSFTRTSLQYKKKAQPGNQVEYRFFFEGEENPAFGEKTGKWLNSLLKEKPFLADYSFQVHTENSFPHSAGIASSASGMSALALCITTLEYERNGREAAGDDFFREASNLSRLGSGSASRSVYGKLAVWGQTDTVAQSADDYAVPYTGELHDNFKQPWYDAILLVSKKEKSVSSRAGHQLMNNHPYRAVRYQQAHDNLSALTAAMQQGDYAAFGRVVENEALTLHGLMMSSHPWFILMQPETLEIIHRLKQWREQNGVPVYFTLDAGPNMHILYPEEARQMVETYISQELVVYCEGKQWIPDRVGKGPVRIV